MVVAILPKELCSFLSPFISREDRSCPLGHWLPIRGDFTPKGYLEMSADILVITTGRQSYKHLSQFGAQQLTVHRTGPTTAQSVSRTQVETLCCRPIPLTGMPTTMARNK